jgi:DNA-binding transcriptional ArsR family regulator
VNAAQLREDTVYSALADPTRRRLLDLLRDGERPVNDLVAAFRVSRPAISQHLRTLREAGLVSETRAGRERRYRLHARALKDVYRWIQRYEQFWDASLARLAHTLDREARHARHS